MASLPSRHYRLAVEPGCGDGGLTAALATRCNRVLASDRDPCAVQACRERTGADCNVEVRIGLMPQDWPDVVADLVVLNEIGFQFGPDGLDALVDRACVGLSTGGTLIAAHRRDTCGQLALGGDDVHAHLFGRIGLSRIGGYADDELRIDVFVGGTPTI